MRNIPLLQHPLELRYCVRAIRFAIAKQEKLLGLIHDALRYYKDIYDSCKPKQVS
jgi:hypothetical protein